MVAVWSVVAGIFGLAIGSFLNVVIYRVPAGLSVVSPPSRCPVCEHQIRERHNIPVFGWLMLRGRCYDCKTPISPRYPLVEAATGALFAVAVAILLSASERALIPGTLALVALVVSAALMLVDGHRPPPKFLALTTIATAVLYLAAILWKSI
ncbi:MAG: prepilin peptidase [Jatrophihabitans sp.]|uniref:prepilin peptidase n=1 Tax=Jatrophihabitans sp. TaxID=1932789 RepID=UPI003F7EC6E9